jgi:ribose transport system substrate-binding protein
MEDNDAIGRLGRRTLTRAKSEEFCLGAFQWIKVAFVDTTLDDTSKVVTAIATDNAAGGAAAADALAKLIGEKGKVLVIAFQAGASTSAQRQKGFENEIKKYPNI